MGRRIKGKVAALLLAALVAGGCVAAGGGTTGGDAGVIEITYTVAGVQATEDHPAGPGGHWDHQVPNAKASGKLSASVTADQTSKGHLVCQITYQDTQGRVWVADQAFDNFPGSVHCATNAAGVEDVMRHLSPILKVPPGGCGAQQPQGCPGPDTLNLNVTWQNR